MELLCLEDDCAQKSYTNFAKSVLPAIPKRRQKSCINCVCLIFLLICTAAFVGLAACPSIYEGKRSVRILRETRLDDNQQVRKNPITFPAGDLRPEPRSEEFRSVRNVGNHRSKRSLKIKQLNKDLLVSFKKSQRSERILTPEEKQILTLHLAERNTVSEIPEQNPEWRSADASNSETSADSNLESIKELKKFTLVSFNDLFSTKTSAVPNQSTPTPKQSSDKQESFRSASADSEDDHSDPLKVIDALKQSTLVPSEAKFDTKFRSAGGKSIHNDSLLLQVIPVPFVNAKVASLANDTVRESNFTNPDARSSSNSEAYFEPPKETLTKTSTQVPSLTLNTTEETRNETIILKAESEYKDEPTTIQTDVTSEIVTRIPTTTLTTTLPEASTKLSVIESTPSTSSSTTTTTPVTTKIPTTEIHSTSRETTKFITSLDIQTTEETKADTTTEATTKYPTTLESASTLTYNDTAVAGKVIKEKIVVAETGGVTIALVFLSLSLVMVVIGVFYICKISRSNSEDHIQQYASRRFSDA